jgi:mycothiol system anti-sigma-R factor
MSGAGIPPLPTECLDVLKQVWDYLDEQLTDESTERLREHLSHCHQCFEYKTFQENFVAALAMLRDRPGASPELRARVMELLRQEGFAR